MGYTDEADAKAGLETENRYYAVIDIPSDFSQNVATAEDVDKVLQPLRIQQMKA
ncbi:MAG: hypothetical protein ACLSCV_06485 [Acutalibacteraceae bacterium]